MTGDFVEEFKTIDLLRQSGAETRGVDAFALSLIKTERQMRRLFTHLIFQFPCFDSHQVADLRNTLAKQKGIYFDGFIKGFDTIYSKSIKQLIGTDYDRLRRLVNDGILIRNKIFHGQITDRRLTRDELFQFVDELTLWCSLLAKVRLANLVMMVLHEIPIRQRRDELVSAIQDRGRQSCRLRSIFEEGVIKISNSGASDPWFLTLNSSSTP